jgi:hypothetical protein
MAVPEIVSGQQACGFSPRWYLVAKIRSERRVATGGARSPFKDADKVND